MTGTFTSYLVDTSDDEDEFQSASYDGTVPEVSLFRLKPSLLPGEYVITQANNVLKFTACSEQRQGISGSLFITNFKLSFVTADRSSYELVDKGQRNKLLAENDICLSNIESVFQIWDVGIRKKKLLPRTRITSQIYGLELHCWDMRIHTFSFKFTPRTEDMKIASAILHHTYPASIRLLFAFEFPIYNNSHDDNGLQIMMFTKCEDWKFELKRLKCERSWRVTQSNERFHLCRSLPQAFVVPSSLVDKQLSDAACHFTGDRIPVWTWSSPEGFSIIRAASLSPTIEINSQMQLMLDHIVKTQPNSKIPFVLEIESALFSLRDLQNSYVKLRELCMPESVVHFWDQDMRYFSSLENSKWLSYVSSCLRVAKEVAICVSRHKVSVVLQESEGRDLSCVVSSLAQLILDPYFRSIKGFQVLVQKEWVSLGHPFSSRLRLLHSDQNKDPPKDSPLFQLFIDCVWQLLQQFPTIFEFSETYLTTLLDSLRISVFDSFLVDSEFERQLAFKDTNNPLPARSVWNWHLLYTESEMTLFLNPLFIASNLLEDQTLLILTSEQKNSFQQHQFTRHSIPAYPPSSSSNSDGKYAETILHNQIQEMRVNLPPKPLHKRSPSLKNFNAAITMAEEKTTSLNILPKWRVDTMHVETVASRLQIWGQYYLRWIPMIQIMGGGNPETFFQECTIVEEIKELSQRLRYQWLALTRNTVAQEPDQGTLVARNMWSPSQLKPEMLTSSFPFSPGGSPAVHGLPSHLIRQSMFYDIEDDDYDDPAS